MNESTLRENTHNIDQSPTVEFNIYKKNVLINLLSRNLLPESVVSICKDANGTVLFNKLLQNTEIYRDIYGQVNVKPISNNKCESKLVSAIKKNDRAANYSSPLRRYDKKSINIDNDRSGVKELARAKTVSYTADNPKKKRISIINIYHEDDATPKHPLNILFEFANEFAENVNSLKIRESKLSTEYILNMSRKLNLGINRKILKGSEFLKSKESIGYYREKVLLNVNKRISEENGFPQINRQYFKFYIEKGNNDNMVKAILKQRQWWASYDKIEGANLIWTPWKSTDTINTLPTNQNVQALLGETIRMHNHLEGNRHLGHKKALYLHLRKYYEATNQNLYDTIPVTFLISKGYTDPEFYKFKDYYHTLEKECLQKGKEKVNNIWIVKPGENTNRGNGIRVSRLISEIECIVREGKQHTYIIQKYIEKPLLYFKRKFDIRCYNLITSVNGNLKAYFYKDGYLRTSSKEFDINTLQNPSIHLTNEAIQKNYDDFGKYENGNKLCYADFQKYLNHEHPGVDFKADIVSQMKCIVRDCIRSTYNMLDPQRRLHTFELLGYDFMITSDFKVLLIEVNVNPCLEIMSSITAKIVPYLLDDTFRIALDPYLNSGETSRKPIHECLPEFKYELIYDSKIDDENLMKLNLGIDVNIDEEIND